VGTRSATNGARIPREFEGPGCEGSRGSRVTLREMTVWDGGGGEVEVRWEDGR
jgi:hypothetical protein